MAKKFLRLVVDGKVANSEALRAAVAQQRGLGHRVEVHVTWEGGDARRFGWQPEFQARFSFRLLSFTEDPPFGVLERIKIPCDTLTTGETLSQLHSPVLVPAAAFVRKH